MDAEEDATQNISDIEDDSKHEALIENVISLSKPPPIKKPSRSEPTIKISEYDLVRSITGSKGSVRVHDLTSVLNQKSSHVAVGRKFKKTEKKAKTLPKPLEKPQADRIRRAVGYEKTRLDLDKWEAVVTANRASVNLRFPLNTNVNFGKEDKSKYEFRIKSDLHKKLEEVDKKYEVHVVETEEDTFPLTLEELMERRREAAKMRAHQSYKEAKARRQNKIKSKKYHRVQRREKLKRQMKEFELLQKTDPEAALKKLEEIEKARAEERFSLRHRSTGQWAKNKQIRAKYDKEVNVIKINISIVSPNFFFVFQSRQVLAQQLAISRDLTQKAKIGSDNESDIEEKDEKSVKPSDPNNPWVSAIKTDEEVDKFIKSYRKYWEEKNKEKEITEAPKNTCADNDVSKNEDDAENCTDDVLTIVAKRKTGNVSNKKSKKSRKNVNNYENVNHCEWKVTSVDDEAALDNCFDNLEITLQNKVKRKSKDVRSKLEDSSKKSTAPLQPAKAKSKSKRIDLSIPKPATKPVIDEELLENIETVADDEKSKELEVLQNILEATSEEEPKPNVTTENIDPDKVIKVKPVSLNTQLPDMLTSEEKDEHENENMAGIAEAFEDDDVVEDFNKEKKEEIEKNKPKNVDLTLPGWGCWGGKDIKTPRRKRRRLIIKLPKLPKRKDMNRGHLIINEDGNDKAKPHLVSEVPFPFRTVKDFEASIRAPIGSTFVPELPHRRMIRPPVRTKMGKVIEPMGEEILMRRALKGLPVLT